MNGLIGLMCLSVWAGRDAKHKIQDEIQKLKYKEPTSPKLVQLEQELVRAEATSLVAEAQLTNVVCPLYLIFLPIYHPLCLNVNFKNHKRLLLLIETYLPATRATDPAKTQRSL